MAELLGEVGRSQGGWCLHFGGSQRENHRKGGWMLQRRVLEAETSGISIVMETDGSQANFSPGSS